MTAFTRATKRKAKLRCAIFGPSGSGKTYSALRIAKGMGGKVAVIDTEHGSACKYADRFTFDAADANQGGIDAVVGLLEQVNAGGYDVCIIDSLSHSWQELLEQVDQIAKARYRGNTWSAWSEGTPKQRTLVRALLNANCHIIATMRSKTEWTSDKDERTGKTTPRRVGLAPEQGKGIEYEFDLLLELAPEHIAAVIKDRTGKFQDKLIEKPDEKFGKQLVAWLNEGTDAETKASHVEQTPPAQPTEPVEIQPPDDDAQKMLITPEQIEELKALCAEVGMPSKVLVTLLDERLGVRKAAAIEQQFYADVRAWITNHKEVAA